MRLAVIPRVNPHPDPPPFWGREGQHRWLTVGSLPQKGGGQEGVDPLTHSVGRWLPRTTP